MNAQEFFWLTARMRQAQKKYFQERKAYALRYCRALEKEVDAEIERVCKVLDERNKTQK